MSEYITAIRTADGDKKYDYNALGNLPTRAVVNISLPAANWIGEDGVYSQVVTVENSTATCQVDLTPSVEQLVSFWQKNITFVAENENGVISVYVIGDKPANDYVIQATVTEVSV